MARYVLVNVDDKADVESFLNRFANDSDDFVSCCGGVISDCGTSGHDIDFPSYRCGGSYSGGCGSSGCGGYSRSRSYTGGCGSSGCGGYSRPYTSGCGGSYIGGHGCG